ncbi:uncharacterized protein LOC116007808 [Ipomoea triloba]|uniref:uncharacterized protein LOC116007808 n=1 Tax=Ipomoea triloba TaxID=35885 RepID=UPI00125D784F|nr:uncharacterized protein LOC116007808 [Ipomoea triloba]
MGESKYAYLLTEFGLYRLNIPDFDPAHQPQFMLECVGEVFRDIITTTMGIFSQGQDVYFFGGIKVEYENQGKPTSLAMPSIEILCSKKFCPAIVSCVCLAYAPASQRCIPWDKVEPWDESNKRELERDPGVVYLDVHKIIS